MIFEGLDFATNIFLISFIVGAVLTLLYVLFGDVLDGVFDMGDGILNPTIILSFITIFCGSGFIFEFMSEMSTLIISLISIVISFILVSLIHIFILVPVSKAEQSTAYNLDELVGHVGKLTVSIPENGFGQISIERKFGYNSHPAKSIDGQPIEKDAEVRITKAENGVFIVELYQERSLKTE